ncbi:tetratricopeptide repeat protein [Reichenbachiella carrageenanivorans]|uniref:Tetratricopeptide repeat protein n=1 Tax=Reichenbachiella carrageenanivorans TaxID=2979869 RepID=A0ABY6D608_9BACT|nr:tetratricopeptide repeat protein [Reichenbachiella carrageenanivorans]UXX79280.1 tetratricopeptide repeat protein [Reichenbachiella carrageenanivorans]
MILVLAVVLFACENEERSKGDELYNEGKYSEAIKAYDEYIGLHPTHVKSIYNRGRSYEELGKFQKAFEDFEAVLEIDKKNTSALLSLAKYYYRDQKFEKAKYYAELAVKENVNLAQAHFWLGRSRHQLGMFAEALTAYNNAINLDRELGEAYLYRGAIKMQSSRNKSACADFKSAKDLGVKEASAAEKKYCK